MSEKTILTLALIFLIGAPLYQFGYVTLSNVSIFGFSFAALLMSFSTLLDNPTKDDNNQHLFRKILKNTTFGLSLFLILLSLMVKESIPFISRIVNSVESNFFLLISIGISFLTLYLGDLYKGKFSQKLEIEKNKAVSKALIKYNKQLEEIEKNLQNKQKD
ncbi:hypothetical protein ACQCWA_19390 [Rossellomorea aquimaris]|uniref:hypothetical protein n=1 Tax=Rossellomorea aquimaris TaxID=189382 RepID=UPI003CF6A4DD